MNIVLLFNEINIGEHGLLFNNMNIGEHGLLFNNMNIGENGLLFNNMNIGENGWLSNNINIGEHCCHEFYRIINYKFDAVVGDFFNTMKLTFDFNYDLY